MIKLNGKEINIVTFPNGERGIKTDNLKIISKNIVSVLYESDQDIFDLFLIKSHIDDVSFTKVETELRIHYLPYSRMDRTEGKWVFTLKHLCNLINSLEFNKVVVLDAHSDVSLALLNNVESVSTILKHTKQTISTVRKASKSEDKEKKLPVYLVLPDLGASKRYKELFKTVKNKIIVMDKVRDFATGDIIKIAPVNPEVITDEQFQILIVDDLCSKGGTFVGTFEALKEFGCKEASLFVAHCEQTIFEGSVPKEFKFVFTSDTIIKPSDIDKYEKENPENKCEFRVKRFFGIKEGEINNEK